VAGGLNEERGARARASEARASWLLGVPAMLLCALVYAQLRSRGALRSEEVLELARSTPAASPSWSGRCELAQGELELALAPLHRESERQRFDAAALAARLGLEPGEPWALDLHWRASEVESDTVAAGRPALDLHGLRVEDTGGAALQPLAESAMAAKGREDAARSGVDAQSAVSDPLLQLYAVPKSELVPGTSARCVLWGRAPREGAELELGALRVALAPLVPAASAVEPER